MGLNEEDTFNDFKRFPTEKLQMISDVIVTIISEKVNPTENLEKVNVSYINGKTIEIQKWYLIHHGHALEEKILDAFPGLGKLKKGKEEMLKYEMIDKIIDDIPDFIPLDILEALKFVQQE